MKDHHKLDVAIELLNDALIQYYTSSLSYSALHLSGAAEEILGAYLKVVNEFTSFQELHSGALEALGYNNENSSDPIYKKLSKAIFDHLNYEKNSVKHGHGSFKADIRLATEQSLDRAMDNLSKLKEFHEIGETELIKAFKNRQLVEMILEDDEDT